jgi:hypothetical protein
MTTETTWHASSLAAYLRCGEAYRRRYIERDHTPPTTPQIRGGAVHRGIGAGLLEQQRSQTITSVELYEDVTATSIDLAQRAGATLTEEESTVGVSQTFGRIKDEAVGYARAYAESIGPTIQPIAVERHVAVRGLLPGILLKGTVDLIDQVEGSEVIRDAKTTERMPAATAADQSAQLTMYALLRQAEAPLLAQPTPVPVSLDYLVRRANGTIETKRLVSTRGPSHFQALARRIQTATRALQAGVFLPSNPETDWWCSDKWCPYWRSCPFVNP